MSVASYFRASSVGREAIPVRKAVQKGAVKTIKQVKAKRGRAEGKVKKSVRAQCVDRDGACFLERSDVTVKLPAELLACDGPSEHMHIAEKKRAKTRGMPPEERHTVEDSCIGCRGHHTAYDAGKIAIRRTTKDGMNGPVVVSVRKSKVAPSSTGRPAQ